MLGKDYYEWLFSDINDIIDCEYNSDEEELRREQNDRERFIETINDTGKSGEHDSQ